MKSIFPLSYSACIGYVVGGMVFLSGLGYEFQDDKTELEKINQTLKFFGGATLIVLAGIAQSVNKEDFQVKLPDRDKDS